MQIGTCFAFAVFHEASTPVPSSMIATAPSAIARLMFPSAFRGESALSYRFTFSVYVPPVPGRPATLISLAASSTPRAIVCPM